ncbi:hypothetical protein Cfor_10219 [Coptotermes formosanus]|uniref:Transporter n=1 Tax=Coptotermes formosanus TaxID=36987 RepID=A0A6L2Q228_COPFO|nr:hypothetical protein Cfor_10219 [Coptotermes formosanus]
MLVHYVHISDEARRAFRLEFFVLRASEQFLAAYGGTYDAHSWTPAWRVQDLQVQLEEDERGYEALVVPPGGPGDLDGGVNDGRETWGRGADFLLSIIGFAVDLANVWRFPYLCYRNGGGAFLIPYTLMMVFGAVPLFYMELILGQYNRQGPVTVWRICPLFKGIGFCAVLVAFYVSFYYNVIIGWALYFLVASANPDLPWLHCNNTWNTEFCMDSQLNNTLGASNNDSANNSVDITSGVAAGSVAKKLHFSPASEYFHRAVLEMQRSGGLQDMGYPKWQLVLCLLVVYTMLYLSLFKGVKSSGKVVWATATLPYVVLTILLIRGLMLPGAIGGIVYYLKPEMDRLSDTQMGGMECVITGLMDEFHSFFQGRRFAREIFTLGAAAVSFSVALINVTPGGIYMFHLFDTYSAGISLLCSALFEAIAVSWFYGLERFSQDVEAMLGSKPGLYWRICWKFISPSFLIRLAINITPLEEHESIRQTHKVSRFRCRHWLYV